MTDFNEGDRIDITIKGATFCEDYGGGEIRYRKAGGGFGYVSANDGVTIERAAPANWPPKPGDVWRDKLGELWFAQVLASVDTDVCLIAANSVRTRRIDDPLFIVRGMTLAYRPEDAA